MQNSHYNIIRLLNIWLGGV